MATAIEQLAADYFQLLMTANPLEATILGVTGFDDRLPDPRAVADAAVATALGDLVTRARAVDPDGLGDMDRVTRAVMLQEADSLRNEYSDGYKDFTVNGPLSGLGDLFMTIPKVQARTPAEIKSFTARIQALPAFVESARQRLLEGHARGRLPVTRLIEQTVEQLNSYLDLPLAQDPFLGPVAPDDTLVGVIADRVRPSLSAFRDTLTRELAATSRGGDRVGVVHLAGGEEVYAHALAKHTTTNQTPEEIHALGLELCRALRGEFAILGQKVFGSSDYDTIVERLRNDPALRYANATEIVADARNALARADEAVPRWFGRIPKAPCVVEVMSEIEAPSQVLGYYFAPAGDGSRPGQHWINTYRPEIRTRYEYETLAFHESVPGHHLQFALGQEMAAETPAFRRFGYVTAYGEGWALYTERLADEMGLYSSDLARFGMLSFDAWRACRLVVDTGLHHYGWSRTRAIEFMLTNSALTLANIENEVDRYIGWPGQACAYMVGRLEITRLRRLTETKQAAAFDISRFYDAVLANGSVPLSVLSDEISRMFGLA